MLVRLNKKRKLPDMKRQQRGYSLIELMVVMTIVLMLSATGLYGWRQWQQQQQLSNGARLLLVWLQHQRDEAYAFNGERVITLRHEGMSWCLTAEPDLTVGCRRGDRRIWQPPWPQIRVADMTPGLAFYGVRNTAWPGHLTLENDAGRWRAVISVWGRIRLCQEGEKGCR